MKEAAEYPRGWVFFTKTDKYTRVKITEGYLNTRFNRYNPISFNQNYVLKVLGNPRTSNRNRRAVIDYVLSHPEKFTPRCECTDDEEFNRWARIRNGGAKVGFMAEFRKKYC